MPAQILTGLVNMAIFLWPIPVLAWADRPKRPAPSPKQEG
jgi:hypothetical protein